MNGPRVKKQSVEQNVVYERCLCRDALDLFREVLGVSPAVREHVRNSRIELLKAVRTVIDERIEYLSTPAQRGTKVTVE